MSTLAEIQKHAQACSQARATLTELLHVMQTELDAVKAGSFPAISRAGRKVAALHSKLEALIKAHPDLFAKPRTQVIDGLKFGLQKQRGSMSWDEDDKLIARIDKLVAAGDLTDEQRDMLVTRTEKPVVKALEKLDAKTIKRLGITVAADTDEVLIKSVDGEIEKAVNAAIKDAIKSTRDEVEA